MKTILKIGTLIITLASIVYFKGCNYSRVNDIKEHATNTLQQAGFVITGYEGYEIGDMFYAPGGKVWYQMVKSNNDSILYNCCVIKFGGEYQIGNLTAINAVSTER